MKRCFKSAGELSHCFAKRSIASIHRTVLGLSLNGFSVLELCTNVLVRLIALLEVVVGALTVLYAVSKLNVEPGLPLIGSHTRPDFFALHAPEPSNCCGGSHGCRYLTGGVSR
jgi:hypothetical protein